MCKILYKKIKGIQCRRCRRYSVQISMEMVFAAFTQHCMQSTDSCRRCQRYSVYSGPSPRQEGRLVAAVHPVGLAVHHHAVPGGSFVFKCSGTCQTTRVIAGKTHSQSPILKCYGGAQQPSNSYEAMTKLHPPHSN